MNINKWLSKNINNLDGKTIAITGTTSGLGLATLTHLAKLNVQIIIGVRDTEKAKNQVESLKKLNNNLDVQILKLDLSDTKSIKSFSENVKKLCPNGLFGLINNAGIFAQNKEILPYSLEKHFFINCVAPILLSNLLLDSLEKQQNSKLVFVSSISFRSAKINLDDVDQSKEKSNIKTYANSKKWLTYYALELKNELQKKGSNICVNIVHPGISATALMHPSHGKFGKSTFSFLNAGMKLIFPKSEKACLSEIYALEVSSKQNSWIGPKIFKIFGFPKEIAIKTKLENKLITKKCYDILNSIIDSLK